MNLPTPSFDCRVCLDQGWVDGPAGIDACGRCARVAEAAWRAREKARRPRLVAVAVEKAA